MPGARSRMPRPKKIVAKQHGLARPTWAGSCMSNRNSKRCGVELASRVVELRTASPKRFSTVPSDGVSVDDGAGLIDGKAWPLVPSGTYSAAYLHYETGKAFNVPRVYLHFKIVDLGPHCGVILYRAYRAKSISGKRPKGGAFKAPRNGDYVREMAAILNLRGRVDRIPPSMLRGFVVRIEVEEVVLDYRQRQLAPALRYSVVRRLICIEAGKESHR